MGVLLLGLFLSSGGVLAADPTNNASATPFVIVCQDAGAGGYEAFPDVCRLQDGRLMCVFYAGYGHVSLPNERLPRGGRICYCLSNDEGRSWSRAQVLYDGPDDDRDPSIVQLRNGRLLCNFFSLRKAGDHYDGLGSWLVTSDDFGRTWSPPRCLTEQYYCSAPVRELPEGRLILGLYRQTKDISAGAVIRSEDGGTTWGPVIDIDNGGLKLDAETDVIALKDGTLFAAERSPGPAMGYSLSPDGGATWSVSKPLGFPGHCPYLLRTVDDIIVLAHRLPNTSLHYSLDETKTWSENVVVDDRIGAYPSMVNLKDGSVLIVYYEEGDGSSIRARRFRATKTGINWLSLTAATAAQDAVPPGGWGSYPVEVTQHEGRWHIAGQRHHVQLDPATFQMAIQTKTVTWRLEGSQDGDLQVHQGSNSFSLRLADAGRKEFTPYRTGFRTGLKIQLAGFAPNGANLDCQLQLFVGLDGEAEDLVCRIIATEGTATVQECLWPGGVESDSFDTTVIPFMQGMLLPKQWPRKVRLYDTLSFGRGLYMPWWGHQQGASALLVILATPADAGCRFEHPAGGPTRLAPRWVHSLGRLAYPREARLCFLDQGNYVELAKRYRREVIESGRFVSLGEKIARNPRVGQLLGSPVIHTSILYHIQPESSYFHTNNPAQNHEVVSFAQRAAELESLAKKNFDRAYVHLDGWGFRGYDNLHPDVLPPCPEAGGWEGLRQLAGTCDRLNFLFAIHDQYRDYYLDAKSYDPRHTLLDPQGNRPLHSTWYGGRQSILCPSLALGHVRKNHQGLLAEKVLLRGAYLDVFAVVPPDECYSPEHPVSRAQCLAYRGACLDSVRAWGGVVSSEEPSDWAIPHLDLVHHGPYALDPGPGQGPAMGIPIPLFNLVYHEALLIPWSLGKGAWGIPEQDLGFLHGLANGGMPYLSIQPGDSELNQVRTLAALHRRVALRELTRHEFLDESWRKQRTTFADGTTVTIDLEAGQYEILPPLPKPQ